MSKGFAPKDKKNPTSDDKTRYFIKTGKIAIHGDANYELTTQDYGQSFGFYQNTGQNAPPVEKGDGQAGSGGPGTGKHVLCTPGMSMECLGEGLKLKPQGDKVCVPAKWIRAENGDIMLDAHNGDIHLRARNIYLDANGGGNEDGEIVIDATRMVQLKGPDIRANCEKLCMKANQECDIITDGFMKMKSAFKLDTQKMDEAFGVFSEIAKKATTLDLPDLGETPNSIANKAVKAIDMLEKGKDAFKNVQGDLKNLAEGPLGQRLQEIAENDELGLEDAATNIGEQVQEFRESEAGKELEDRFRGFIQGFGGST